jgi:hypothetical protein
MARGPGLEPGTAVPETAVLPITPSPTIYLDALTASIFDFTLEVNQTAL